MLVLDQLIIPKLIVFFILITYLVDIVLILLGEILSWSLVGVGVESDLRFENFNRKYMIILSFFNLVIGYFKKNRENYSRKAFEQRNKEIFSFLSRKGLLLFMCQHHLEIWILSIFWLMKEHRLTKLMPMAGKSIMLNYAQVLGYLSQALCMAETKSPSYSCAWLPSLWTGVRLDTGLYHNKVCFSLTLNQRFGN